MSTTAGTQVDEPTKARHVGDWEHPALVAPSKFQHKSLCCWSVNVAMGCLHGCTFCYVPSVSVNKQKAGLQAKGVNDPGGEWGHYGFLRSWNEKLFLASLRKAETTSAGRINADGNRAVLYSSTTDPYQAWTDPRLQARSRDIMRRSLELIRDRSSLNVRILTRSPLAREDFDLYRSFGHRLVFCMSIPTLKAPLARMYEPHAPAPTQRLKALREAKKDGLHVGVAIAPTYPECDEADLRATFEAVKDIDPVTIYHEPINERADNVRRMEARAVELGVRLNTAVYESTEAWVAYQLRALRTVEELAGEMELEAKLKLWIDNGLATEDVIEGQPDPAEYRAWVDRWQGRIADWPRKPVGNGVANVVTHAPPPIPATTSRETGIAVKPEPSSTMKKNARPKKPSRNDGLSSPSQVHYWLARLAQGFLEEGDTSDRDFLSALQKARRLFDMARGEGLPAPSSGEGATTASSGPFEDNEVLPVTTIAARMRLKRTTLDGYITELEGQGETSAEVKGIRVGRKYRAKELWTLLNASEVTKKKVERAQRRWKPEEPLRILQI